jgi:hypothetical protein
MDVEEMRIRLDYIEVAHDMETWRPLVNAVMNLRFRCKEMNLVTS